VSPELILELFDSHQTRHHARHSNSSVIVRVYRLSVIHVGAVCWQFGEISAQSRLANSMLSNHDVYMSSKDCANLILAGYLFRGPELKTLWEAQLSQ
jgi:hypothetical protein